MSEKTPHGSLGLAPELEPPSALGDPFETSAVFRPEQDSLFSLEPVARWTRFTLHAVRRHWIVAIATFVVTVTIGGMLFAPSPPQFTSTATVLLAGDRVLGGTEGVTTIASNQAESVIHRRESLDRMIDELDLIQNEAEPPFFGRLRNTIQEKLTGPEQLSDKVEALRAELRTAIIVTPNDRNSSIDVSVNWSNPDQAAALASLSYDIFFDERTRVEVEPLSEAVQILEEGRTRAKATVDDLRSELELSPGDGAPAGSALEGAVQSEQDLEAQLRAAQLKLQEAQAGIKFRYSLLAPPEVPLQPTSGNLTGYIAATILGALAAAGVCFAIDAPRGRIVAQWQLDQVGIRVLGTIRLDDLKR